MSAGSSIQLWLLNSQGVTTRTPPFPFQRKKWSFKAGISGADITDGAFRKPSWYWRHSHFSSATVCHLVQGQCGVLAWNGKLRPTLSRVRAAPPSLSRHCELRGRAGLGGTFVLVCRLSPISRRFLRRSEGVVGCSSPVA